MKGEGRTVIDQVNNDNNSNITTHNFKGGNVQKSGFEYFRYKKYHYQKKVSTLVQLTTEEINDGSMTDRQDGILCS